MLRVPELFGRTRDVVSIVTVAALMGCGAAEAGSRTTAPSPSSQASRSLEVRPVADLPASETVATPRAAGELGMNTARRGTEQMQETDGADGADDDTPTEPLEILFVGNSYTHYNDMPALLLALAEDADVPVEIDAYTVGGAKLVEHADNDAVHRKLAERDWDFVVLQAHSLEVFRNRDGFDEAMDDLAAEAAELGAEPVTFETWARREGHNVLRWYDLTPDTMQDTLLAAYRDVAERNDARLAPVGEAWRRVHATHPDAGLHLSDGSHPSVAGSFLTACVFLNVLLDEHCSESSFVPESLDPDLAARLRAVADDTAAMD